MTTDAFFASPIPNTPHDAPTRHGALDGAERLTGTVVAGRRRSDLATPIPKPR